MDRTNRYCVIGAGTSGLATVKNLLDRGIPVDVLEGQDDIGGNWYYGSSSSTLYHSAHLISSKGLAGYLDLPMPAHYPDYPGHVQVLEYLRTYAETFELRPHIEFSRKVQSVQRVPEGWQVDLDGAETRVYRGVIVANGHHGRPSLPRFAGEFHGEVLHSADYRRPESFAGKRVLIVGGGNSACDIAVDLLPFAAQTTLSMRRGYHIWPKFAMGRPIDEVNELTHRLRLPLPARTLAARLLLRALVGTNADYGMPEPDHGVFDSHLLVNSRLLYHLRHGDLTVQPDAVELLGDRVRFADGSLGQFDVIICATGFLPSFPFLEQAGLSWVDSIPQLYLHLCHPREDNFFAVGMVQPDVGIWRLADHQSRLVARFIDAQQNAPAAARRFAAVKARPSPRMSPYRYVDSPRHRLEVEHVMYEARLQSEIDRFDRALGARRGQPVDTPLRVPA